MGPISERYLSLQDARWNEKLAAIILIAGIIAIGITPFWLNDLVTPAADIIMQKVAGK
jgi:NADH:ubiquinone oxidoreductase subunit 4 (subunit M)